MKKTLLITFFTCVLGFNFMFSQETFKAMFYNILNYPLQTNPPNRLQYLDLILSDFQPDIFMVCELNNETGANSLLSMMQLDVNSNYAMANFELNSSDDDFGDQNDLQNLMYYDNTKFILESQTIVATKYRDFNHYKLKLNTIEQTSNALYLDIIVCHLKSSSGTANQAIRLEMVQDLTTYLNTLPADSYVMIGGDLNVYTNSEDAYEELLNAANNITFVDPANRSGSWHNNLSYIDVFTQSTRTVTGLGGATGGFDDRFDFILTSENMLSNTELFYVNNSYSAFGNNANVTCFNQEINSSDCDGANFSLTIRDALYNFSDHLPVTIEIETNQSLLSVPEFVSTSTFEIIGTNVIQNTLKLRVNNQLLTTKKLEIFNTLGQLIQTINLEHSEDIITDVSNLSSGIYYITVPQLNVEPLKFVKVY